MPFLNLQFSIILIDKVESSSASESNAARATKTQLEMVWMQVEQNSLLMAAGGRSGLDSNWTSLNQHCLLSHVVISVPIKKYMLPK